MTKVKVASLILFNARYCRRVLLLEGLDLMLNNLRERNDEALRMS